MCKHLDLEQILKQSGQVRVDSYFCFVASATVAKRNFKDHFLITIVSNTFAENFYSICLVFITATDWGGQVALDSAS